MYNRQEPEQAPVPPVLEEQLHIPIYQIISELKQGRTIRVAMRTQDGYFISAVNGGGKRVDATSTVIGTNELFSILPVRPDQVDLITAKGYFVLVLATEPRYVTAYGVAAGPRTNLRIVPQV